MMLQQLRFGWPFLYLLFDLFFIIQFLWFLSICMFDLFHNAIGNGITWINPILESFCNFCRITGWYITTLGIIDFQKTIILKQFSMNNICNERFVKRGVGERERKKNAYIHWLVPIGTQYGFIEETRLFCWNWKKKKNLEQQKKNAQPTMQQPNSRWGDTQMCSGNDRKLLNWNSQLCGGWQFIL